jgi:hypothetical protein
MKRFAAVVSGIAFVSAGTWFLYRHLLYAGFFDPRFTVLSTMMVVAGLGLLWFGRPLSGRRAKDGGNPWGA